MGTKGAHVLSAQMVLVSSWLSSGPYDQSCACRGSSYSSFFDLKKFDLERDQELRANVWLRFTQSKLSEWRVGVLGGLTAGRGIGHTWRPEG